MQHLRGTVFRSRSPVSRFLLLICATPLIAQMSNSVSFAQRQPRTRVQKRAPAPRVDYANFSHRTHTVTQKLSCDSCHKLPTKNWKDVRSGDAGFPDVAEFPDHSSCLSCHRTQFFARERPAPTICSNCHIAATPRDTTRWLFPSLGDIADEKFKRREAVSEFRVFFPHDRHMDAIGRLPDAPGNLIAASYQVQKQPASCPVCHVTYQPQGNSSDEYVTKPPKNLGDNFWLKKGTFKTVPNSHAACFTCHNPDAGIAPDSKDCHSCHKLTPPRETPNADFDVKLAAEMGLTDQTQRRLWANRNSAGTFRHEGGEHPNINCLSCHKVETATFNTTDVHSTKVPVKSCGGAEGCHITATADDGGIMNYELDQKAKYPKFVCTKCHVTFGKEQTPASHAQAIPAPATKSSD